MSTNVNKRLSQLSKGKVSNWKSKVEFRIKNRKWLNYSSNIARRVLAAIEDNKDLNQKQLAEQIGVTPQYISKVVKGKENLSLETIAKLSDALNVELISFPNYKYNNFYSITTQPFAISNQGNNSYETLISVEYLQLTAVIKSDTITRNYSYLSILLNSKTPTEFNSLGWSKVSDEVLNFNK